MPTRKGIPVSERVGIKASLTQLLGEGPKRYVDLTTLPVERRCLRLELAVKALARSAKESLTTTRRLGAFARKQSDV